MDNLYEVAKDNFIVLTTKEGARGIDYKGVNPAHVIMAFNPKSYSECVQALGRGCRELSSFAEGTIIC
jgi:superfamily II DNA/RNA helicase